MNVGIQLITDNIGLGLPYIFLIIMLIGNLVFFAKDFKLGLLLQFMSSSILFMWAYYNGWNYKPIIVVALLSLILLSFSLYAVSKNSSRGVFV